MDNLMSYFNSTLNFKEMSVLKFIVKLTKTDMGHRVGNTTPGHVSKNYFKYFYTENIEI